MKSFVSKLGLFSYTIHNLIAHPLMELLHLIGLTELGNKIHDNTLPFHHTVDHETPEDRVRELEEELNTLKGKYMNNLAELEPYREAERLYSEWFACMGVPHVLESTIEVTTEELQKKVSEFKSASAERREEIRAEFRRNLS